MFKDKRKIINNLTKIAILAALSFTLYWVKFPVFPGASFLEIQFSNIPAILGGLMLGPIEGCLIVIVRFLLKLPFSHTVVVGELADLIIGLVVVLISSLIYKNKKTKIGGILSLVFAWVAWIISAMLCNALITLPLYVKLGYLTDDVSMVLWTFILPFNLILASAVCLINFFIYKPVAKIFHKDFFNNQNIGNGPSAIICCDSFKGTLSSEQVNDIIDQELKKLNYRTKKIAISDGGEGFLEALKAARPNLERHDYSSYNAVERQVETKYLYDPKNQVAYFCLADTVGITKMSEAELDPLRANTYGLGLLMRHAIKAHPIKRIVFGIGGSASTDAGCGMLEALGVKFFDKNDQPILGLNNEKLNLVARVDTRITDAVFSHIEVYCLTDVTNPLFGENGAAYVYGPQKGANPSQVKQMDQALIHFSKIVSKHLGYDYSKDPGMGAAGGVGFAAKAFMHAKMEQGIRYLLNLIEFEKMVAEYDMVITGEGALDSQSLSGKVISGILEYKPKKVKFVCGINKLENFDYDVYAVVPQITTAEYSMKHPDYYLATLIKRSFGKEHNE